MTRQLIRGAHIVSMDPEIGDIESGDILIEDGVILEVSSSVGDVGDADITNAEGAVVLPGFVNTHNHLWQTPIRGVGADCWGEEYFPIIHPYSHAVTADVLNSGTYIGAIEALSHGVTTIFDFCHSIHTPDHATQAANAFEEAGIRTIFGYSMRARPEAGGMTQEDRMADARRVYSERFAGGGLLNMAIAMNNVDHVSDEQNQAETDLARDLGVRRTIHTLFPSHVGDFARQGLLGPDLQWVHTTASSEVELAAIAEHGGSLSITPESEAFTTGMWPITGRALAAGIPLGLGIDLPSVFSASMTNQGRAAITLSRLYSSHVRRVQGHPPVRDGGDAPLDVRRALSLLTIEGAASVGLGDVTGSLSPGKQADIVMMRPPRYVVPAGDIAAWVVVESSRADVESVWVGGVLRVDKGELVGVDLDRAEARAREARAAMAKH